MEFWRGPAYTAYVDYLEASGGFYYEVRGPDIFLGRSAECLYSDGAMRQYTA